MRPEDGPYPCVVCGDAATGHHYRAMTCEGCKVRSDVIRTVVTMHVSNTFWTLLFSISVPIRSTKLSGRIFIICGIEAVARILHDPNL